jgi:hypothetical protein
LQKHAVSQIIHHFRPSKISIERKSIKDLTLATLNIVSPSSSNQEFNFLRRFLSSLQYAKDGRIKPKTIVVVGATGNQGSSVAHTFAYWNVRATTRNPSSPAAQALAARGAEVVQVDLSDISSLFKAFQDAHAIFVNTDFWTTYKPLMAEVTADAAKLKGQPEPSEAAFQTEVSHGKNAAQAAAKSSDFGRLCLLSAPADEEAVWRKVFSILSLGIQGCHCRVH